MPITVFDVTALRNTLIAAAMVVVASIASSDPVTPPEHNELKYRSIGAGLYVDAEDIGVFQWFDESGNECDSTQSTCGITSVSVYSKEGIETGNTKYIFDDHDEALRNRGLGYDAGKLGVLTSNSVTLDCVNQTYRLTDAYSGDHVWRAAKSLPALAPVFRYVCSHRKRVAS